MVSTIPFQFYQVENFSNVQEAFQANFENGSDVGASVTIIHKDKIILEMSGGYSDVKNEIPYTKDTLQAVYSSSKAVTCLVVGWLVDRGFLDYNALVTTYWPEFGQNNKDRVTLKDVLCHQGGVAWFDHKLTRDVITNKDQLRKAIETQPHNFDGEPKRCYHGVTRGFILNEIVSRVDPKSRSIGQILQDEFCERYGIEFYYGIKDPTIRERNAKSYADSSKFSPLNDNDSSTPQKDKSDPLFETSPLIMKVLHVITLDNSSVGAIDPSDCHDVEIPSVNGHTTASSLAKLLSLMISKDSPISASTRKLMMDDCLKLNDEALGYETELTQGGLIKFTYDDLNLEMYGGDGYGGSLVIFDPKLQVTFAYVPNCKSRKRDGDSGGYQLYQSFYQDFQQFEKI